LRTASLTGIGAGAVGAGVLASGADQAAASETGSASTPSASAAGGIVPFHGAHQAGIATPAQNYLQFAAFDLVSHSVADLRKLMRTWSHAALLMSRGLRIGEVSTLGTPPDDTGEAIGLGPADLTVTFGFGPSLFTSAGLGLAHRRPKPLVDLPAFVGDALEPAISGGDLCVQVCANDPQVAFHAVHDLIKLAAGMAKPAWLLAGFGRTGNSRRQSLPRNLMGFQDGTANIKVEDAAAVDRFVWAKGPASPAWMHGGSYLVARRIVIALGLWDATNLSGQQDTVGREKLAGTRLHPMPPTAHILLTSPALNGGQQILRRGYSFTDGVAPPSDLPAPAAGLMFLCYQSDPRRQFIPIQRRIAGKDALSLYLRHIGSAVFACPPGARPGGYVGETLLG
jgi:deferrochelatase/peroxidase EfeB